MPHFSHPPILPIEQSAIGPGGRRARSQFHRVGPGQSLNIQDKSVQLRDENDAIIKKIPVFDDGVEKGFNGWLAWTVAGYTFSENIEFNTSFTVPEPPNKNDGQTVFIFPGMENFGSNLIIQPVLQWGRSGAGDLGTWAIASWYVSSSGDAFHTDLQPVSSGQVLEGVIRQSKKDDIFTVVSSFHGLPGTELIIHNSPQMTTFYEALEVYNLDNQLELPASSPKFFDITVKDDGKEYNPLWFPRGDNDNSLRVQVAFSRNLIEMIY